MNSKCGVQSKRAHYYFGGLLLLLKCHVLTNRKKKKEKKNKTTKGDNYDNYKRDANYYDNYKRDADSRAVTESLAPTVSKVLATRADALLAIKNCGTR